MISMMARAAALRDAASLPAMVVTTKWGIVFTACLSATVGIFATLGLQYLTALPPPEPVVHVRKIETVKVVFDPAIATKLEKIEAFVFDISTDMAGVRSDYAEWTAAIRSELAARAAIKSKRGRPKTTVVSEVQAK